MLLFYGPVFEHHCITCGFVLGGHRFHRKITHTKQNKYRAMNISWGTSQYRIRCIQWPTKDCVRLSPRKLCSRIVSGQVKPTIVSAVTKPMTAAWEILRRRFRTQDQPNLKPKGMTTNPKATNAAKRKCAIITKSAAKISHARLALEKEAPWSCLWRNLFINSRW